MCSAGSEVSCLMRSVCTLLPNEVCRHQLRAVSNHFHKLQINKQINHYCCCCSCCSFYRGDCLTFPWLRTEVPGVSDVTRVQVTDGWMSVGHSPSEFLTSCSCACYWWACQSPRPCFDPLAVLFWVFSVWIKCLKKSSSCFELL